MFYFIKKFLPRKFFGGKERFSFESLSPDVFLLGRIFLSTKAYTNIFI